MCESLLVTTLRSLTSQLCEGECVCVCVCRHVPGRVFFLSLSLCFVFLSGSFLIEISIFCQLYDGWGSGKQHVPVFAFEPALQMCGVLFPLLPLGLSSILAVNFDMCKLIIIQSK